MPERVSRGVLRCEEVLGGEEGPPGRARVTTSNLVGCFVDVAETKLEVSTMNRAVYKSVFLMVRYINHSRVGYLEVPAKRVLSQCPKTITFKTK